MGQELNNGIAHTAQHRDQEKPEGVEDDSKGQILWAGEMSGGQSLPGDLSSTLAHTVEERTNSCKLPFTLTRVYPSPHTHTHTLIIYKNLR